MTELLKLRGTDAEDLSVLSLCLQDALVQVSDMTWRPGAEGRKGKFGFTTQRLCHEDKSDGLKRINCRFWVDGVTQTQHKTDVQDETRLILLAIVAEGADVLKLHFNNQKTIKLQAPGWHAYLEDFGVHWPAEAPPPHSL